MPTIPSEWKKNPPNKLLRERCKNREIVEISRHALERMKERRVTQKEVLAAIRKPSKRGLPTQEGRERVRKNRSSKEAIDVVYELHPDRVFVVTTFVVQTGKKRR